MGASTIRILLVEDNALIREMFAYGLRKYFRNTRQVAVEVDMATDGRQAWRMLKEDRYDIAVVDHYLPILGGADLVERIRGDEALRALPVVAISIGGVEARDACLAAGATLFLDKPFVLRDLFSTLERLPRAGGVT